MKYWPVPNSYSKNIPTTTSPGSFWENRGDRHHCGIDIYAPAGSDVLSVENGKVIDIGIFTSTDKIPYWNTTYYVLVKNNTGFICKYAELNDVVVIVDKPIRAGQLIGHVGSVLNLSKVTEESPLYIQKLKKNGKPSMLHFELYKSHLTKTKNYLGGNSFSNAKPENLLDPTDYLISALNTSTH